MFVQILSQIVRTHMDSSDLVLDPKHPLNFTALVTQTEGYSANDLKDLVARAVHRAAMRVAEHEAEADFQVSFQSLLMISTHSVISRPCRAMISRQLKSTSCRCPFVISNFKSPTLFGQTLVVCMDTSGITIAELVYFTDHRTGGNEASAP